MRNFTIGELLHAFRGGVGYANPNWPEGTRFVLGFPLPTFQRGFVWTDAQKESFIQSVWHDFPIGTYMINEVPGAGDPYTHPLQDLVIDGQQRMKALEDYFADRFEVFGSVWSEVPVRDQRHFSNKGFGRQVIFTDNEQALRAAYNALNFGGTAHSEADRA